MASVSASQHRYPNLRNNLLLCLLAAHSANSYKNADQNSDELAAAHSRGLYGLLRADGDLRLVLLLEPAAQVHPDVLVLRADLLRLSALVDPPSGKCIQLVTGFRAWSRTSS